MARPILKWVLFLTLSYYSTAMGEVQYSLINLLHSSELLLNESGTVIQQIQYSPFGEIVEENQGTEALNFRYTSQEWDSTTDLYYYGARYYEPALSRFFSVDPKVLQSGDPYTYASGNPVNRMDPDGRLDVDVDPDFISNAGGIFTSLNGQLQEEGAIRGIPPVILEMVGVMFPNPEDAERYVFDVERSGENKPRVHGGYVTDFGVIATKYPARANIRLIDPTREPDGSGRPAHIRGLLEHMALGINPNLYQHGEKRPGVIMEGSLIVNEYEEVIAASLKTYSLYIQASVAGNLALAGVVVIGDPKNPSIDVAPP
jgi:RHS repeat-associated protein